MKTILMTGGTGFLGRNLLKRFSKANFRIILLKRLTSDTSRIDHLLKDVIVHDIDDYVLRNLFHEYNIDVILHCATNYGRRETIPHEILEANLFLPLRLLEYGKNRGVKCFVNTDTILDKQVSHYSLSKSQFKDWLVLYANDMTCINVALEHFYGPGDDATKFVTFTVRNILKKVERIPFTKGEQKRDFIYIDDVAEAFWKILLHSESLGRGFTNFDIGSGQMTSIRDFVRLVQSLANNSCTFLDFGALPYRLHEVMESAVDTMAIRSLGWRPSFSLEEGLMQTISTERETL